ncbi:neurotransmitter:Na+ symporter, NSS family [Fontibacillus panacisegetis]|uniref:Transporter n=1 Tax=Fontibacillus panacisegetis TaxID=670482 RepID=A0A1G7FYY1_9BACL|nr:sodium-dependent transporter [Fontibacillus panacisegetis]SDE81049.1 neurotransmitter:Na+ symporter, NSS family [Fontibacillus panacisegetis]
MKQNKENANPGSGKGERFSSSGFILAAIGSAVGLGNMWKFPYITGQNGGAAFFLLFIICLIIVGLPVLMAELAIGRGGRGNASTSFFKIGGNRTFGRLGLLSVIAPTLILSFYSIVAGWTLHYAVQTFSGKLFTGGDFSEQFNDFTSGYMSIVWTFVVMVCTCAVIIKGVSSGIEKFNKILIPGMLILLIVLMIRALTLPGAGEGASFFLRPDFSKLSAEAALVALGHAFFSLSLGMGTMITYGSYVERKQSLGAATFAIGGGDLLYAFIAGLIIFPTTFSFGIDAGQGPGLVFVALPAAFSAMPFGSLFGGLFFVLLAIAALTSTVSLLEVPVAFTMERWGWSRKKAACILAALIFVLSIPSLLSLGLVPELKIANKGFFDFMDFVASNILLPLGGLIVTIFVGYFWKNVAEEVGLKSAWFRIWLFMLRYVAPILIALIFLYSSGLLKL